MQLNFKKYQTFKTKQYLIKNNFLIFSIGANQNTQNWITVEQNLYKLKFDYHKVYNNITRKIIKNSIYRNLFNTINSTFFFLKPKIKNKQIPLKSKILKSLNLTLFTVLFIKLNNKIYTIPKLKHISSFCHKTNMTTMYQSLITNLKLSYVIV